MILKANNKSEGIGQKSYDDEVNKLIILDSKRDFFLENKYLNDLTFSSKSIYIVCAKRLLICLVIVTMVEECNCYRSYFNRVFVPQQSMKNLVHNSPKGWTRPWFIKGRRDHHGRLCTCFPYSHNARPSK